MKLLLTSIYCFSFSPIMVLTESAKAQDVSYETFKTFQDWCENKDSLSKEIRQTVDILIEKAKTSDCKLANEKLSNYRDLNITNRGISNLLPLISFSNLTRLNLNKNQIVSIQPLEKLTKLTELGISDNRISDLSPLRNMKDLTFLAVKRNQISDVSPLQNLTNLQSLFLDDNKITDIMPLQSLKKLSLARFTGNPIIKKICPVEGTVYMPKCSF